MNKLERLCDLVKERGPLLAEFDPDIDEILKIYERKEKNYISKDDYEEYSDYLKAIMTDYCYEYIMAVKDEVVAIEINVASFEENKMEDLIRYVVEEAEKAGLSVIADVN